jgi:hypothetical protein
MEYYENQSFDEGVLPKLLKNFGGNLVNVLRLLNFNHAHVTQSHPIKHLGVFQILMIHKACNFQNVLFLSSMHPLGAH